MAQSNRGSSSKGRTIPKFVNRPPNPDTVKRRAENRGGRFDSIFKDGFDAFRPKDGENAIRFLPPTWEGDEGMDYAYEIWVHAFVGPDDSTYLCPWKMNNKPCPLCDAARDSKKAGEEDEYKKLEVKQQFVAWVIDRNGDEDTPLLYQMSRNIDKDISGIRENKRGGGYLWVSHTEEGYDLYFKRTGAGLKTRYSAWSFDRDPSPISDDRKTQEGVLEYIQDHPIPDVLKFYDADHLEKIASGTVVEKDEDDNDGERDDRDERDDKDDRSERGRRERDRDDDDRSSRRRSEREDNEEQEARSERGGRSSRSVPRERVKPAPEEPSEESGEDEGGEDEGDRKPSGRGRDRGSSRDRDDDRGRGRSRNDDGDEDGRSENEEDNPLPDEEEGRDRRRSGRDRDRDERPRRR